MIKNDKYTIEQLRGAWGSGFNQGHTKAYEELKLISVGKMKRLRNRYFAQLRKEKTISKKEFNEMIKRFRAWQRGETDKFPFSYMFKKGG